MRCTGFHRARNFPCEARRSCGMGPRCRRRDDSFDLSRRRVVSAVVKLHHQGPFLPASIAQTDPGLHTVVHRPSNRRLSYGELATAASNLQAPKKEDVPLKARSSWRYVGKDMPRGLRLWNRPGLRRFERFLDVKEPLGPALVKSASGLGFRGCETQRIPFSNSLLSALVGFVRAICDG